jgi:hypothetical protein
MKTLLIAFILLSSCGGDNSTSHRPDDSEQQQGTIEGRYRAVLRPVNPQASGRIPYGMALLEVTGEKLRVSSWLDDAAAVAHPQTIWTQGVCPIGADAPTAQQLMGARMLELRRPDGTYPQGSAYRYQAEFDLSREDGSEIRERGLIGRTLLVQGASGRADLPVACGIIQRIGPAD